MTPTEATDLARQAIMLMLVLATPILLTGLIVGVIVAVLQAVTQVQEITLSFVPKILAMLIAVAITGPWILERLTDFGRRMFGP